MSRIQDALRWGIPFLICACQLSDQGSELPNEVTGSLYQPNGSPAVSAEVDLYPVNYQPGSTGSSVLSTTTDSKGQFRFAQVPTGEYNLLGRTYFKASNDSLFSFRDSLAVSQSVALTPDTVSSSGSVTGTLQLQAGDDPRTVLLLVLGTDILAAPDSIGRFTLTLPAGNYQVRVLTTLDKYLPLDLPFTIAAGVQDTLESSIALPFVGIPVAAVTFRYDTLQQIASFSWKQADTALASGYNLYLQHLDSGYVRINTIPVPIGDTTFVDSILVQDDGYEFGIKVLDKHGNEGSFSNGINFQAAGIYQLVDSANMGNFTSIHYNGTGRIVADAPPSSGNTAITLMDTSLNVLQTFNLDSISSIEGIDASNRIWANDGANNIKVFSPEGSSQSGAYTGTPTSMSSFALAASAVAVKKTRVFVGMSGEILVYDTSFKVIGEFPSTFAPYSFNALNLAPFDNMDNSTLTVQWNGNTLSIYDTLGALQSQRSLPEPSVKWLMPTYDNGFFVYHCQPLEGCYYDRLDSTLNRSAIFLGRAYNSNTPLTSFVDSYNRIFLMQSGGAIKIYAPRHPF